jgi:hypothetical protein
MYNSIRSDITESVIKLQNLFGVRNLITPTQGKRCFFMLIQGKK